METHAPKAVFLSHASQDSDAARRIAQALRADGIEVWFDESELRGGEEWDASIRRQIGECSLFVAIISEHTQARREGYFRLEWRLSDERTHLMAEGTPFVLPVIVDAIKERDALVPKSFLNVQWTWLPHGEVPPAFVARVQKLLGGAAPRAAEVATPTAAAATVSAKTEASEVTRPWMSIRERWRPSWLRVLPWITTLAFGGVVVWLGLRQRPASESQAGSPSLLVTHTTISLPPEAPLAVSPVLPLGLTYPSLALSPDGTQLVYVASVGQSTQLYRRPLDEPVARPIPGTEGGYYPFFSPDGRWVGFFSKGKLKKVSILGGSAVTLGDSGGQIQAACWGDDGYIYFQPHPSLRRISDRGGTSALLRREEGTLYVRSSDMLPGANWMLGSFRTAEASTSGDFSPISAHSIPAGQLRAVIDRGYSPRFLPAGYLVFARGGGLHVVAFDPGQARAIGQPVPMIEGVLSNALECVAQFAVSANGTLVFAAGGALDRATPAWVRRSGQVEKLPMEPQPYGSLRLSPDGRRFAVNITDVRDNIWIFDAATGKGAPLTEVGVNQYPLWTPDGQRLIFRSRRKDRWGIYAKSLATSDKPAAPLFVADDAETRMYPNACYADGRTIIAYLYTGATRKAEHVALALDGSGKMEPANVPKNMLEFVRYSPDGRWFGFTSSKSGRSEVYLWDVSSGQEHQISFDGGEENTWSAKGDELFFRNRDAWFVATLTNEPAFRAEVHELFKGPFLNVPGYSYDTAPDGQRFLMLMPEHIEAPVTQLQVIVNWTEEVKRRVSAGAGAARAKGR